jgi:hypothetical protein
MPSTFLVFDIVGRNASLQSECNAQGCILPELNDREEAVALVVKEEG